MPSNNPPDKLQTDLFQCIVLRGFGSTDRSAHPFPALPLLVNCVKKQSADGEVSNVTNVEIVSERSDSKSTLFGVTGRLQQIFIHDITRSLSLLLVMLGHTISFKTFALSTRAN